MLRIRKEKLYGLACGFREFCRDPGDLIEWWKLQRDRIAAGAMVGDRVGKFCAILQWNVSLISAGYATGQPPRLSVAFSNLNAAISIPSGRRA